MIYLLFIFHKFETFQVSSKDSICYILDINQITTVTALKAPVTLHKRGRKICYQATKQELINIDRKYFSMALISLYT